MVKADVPLQHLMPLAAGRPRVTHSSCNLLRVLQLAGRVPLKLFLYMRILSSLERLLKAEGRVPFSLKLSNILYQRWQRWEA